MYHQWACEKASVADTSQLWFGREADSTGSAENVDAYDRGFSLKHVACVVSSMIETDLYKVRVKEISGVL